MDTQVYFIEGRRILLRPLMESDFTDAYLCWLNNPELNVYSQRRPFPVSWKSMRAYIEGFEGTKRGFILAIIDKEGKGAPKHIGNVGLVNIQPIHRCAEPVILIGRKAYWGQGYCAEAIYHISKHAFWAMNLHKVFAGTFNPAFAKSMLNLGWTEEGRFKERIWSGGRYHDQVWLAMLRTEFKAIDRFERQT